ncbi:MAG: hypothetical protein KJP22_10430 [Acidimicrobiia bacterium]|nr:hypothetical protein [Acidimicrobiia bacterium]NNF09287.1 hypothetical protein [Acidimicrobiia bacterium]NNL47228.1 hypothetical protein [Acidimicrobiia bacterium]NNL69029.1 hypothetical protein [Acidimicrobiia bacterium]
MRAVRGSTIRIVVAGLVVLALGGCYSDPAFIDDEIYVSPDGLLLNIGIGSCNADIVVTVEETATEVIVTPSVENDSGDDCADGFLVTLAKPLGERTVVDGRNGETFDAVVSYELGR